MYRKAYTIRSTADALKKYFLKTAPMDLNYREISQQLNKIIFLAEKCMQDEEKIEIDKQQAMGEENV